MNIAWVFAIFAAVAVVLGATMPHLVHRLGFRMAMLYLAFAVIAAVIGLVRRAD